MAFDTLINKSQLEAALTSTANAIRAKTGDEALIEWKSDTGFSDAIANLSTEELLKHIDIPDYVKAETLRVANMVQEVKKDNSIIFLAMSDSHYYGDQQYNDTNVDSNGVQGNTGNLHSAMAAKILAYTLNFDFMTHLGDVTFGAPTTTSALLQSQVGDLVSFLRESHKGIPCFHAVGNHDTGIYSHNAGLEGGAIETGEWIYNNFTSLSESENTVFGNTTYGGYCYRDFEDKKLRVFLLNTSEELTKNARDNIMSGEQTQWFADALVGLNSKTDASDWSFIILCHYPADYGGTMFLSELLKMYVEGTNGTVTSEDNTVITCNFSGANSAKMIAQFHGHVHNFLYSKLHSYATGSGVKYDAWRVGIPNAQYNRENYYTTVGNYTDINFKDEVTYFKTPNTAKDTSFVINVINPDEQVIHSITYGAGPTIRSIGYGATVYHKVLSTLSGVTLSNTYTSVEEGAAYITEILPNEHCKIQEVVVTMGGTDITATTYGDGIINIPVVTGDISITATAKIQLACTNWIPLSTTSDGAIYNGVGYKENTRLHNGAESPQSGICTTGFIPIANGDILRLENMLFTNADNNYRLVFYDSSYTFLGMAQGNSTYILNNTLKGIQDENGNYIQFTMTTTASNFPNCAYVRVCCANITDISIITINEEIRYTDELAESYTVTNVLRNVTTSNTANTVVGGAEYSATITGNNSRPLTTLSVTMGGVDITSDVVTGNTIYIKHVIGDIIIEAFAATYTNQIPISTDTDGSIFNGKGWQEGKRVTSSGALEDATGSYATGFIPAKKGDIIYLKNVHYEKTATTNLTLENQRICFYDASKAKIGILNAVSTIIQSRIYDGNHLIQFTVDDISDFAVDNAAYFRLNCVYIGNDSIITVNEPIDDTEEKVEHNVTTNLTNVIINNNASSVEEGSSYTATLTPYGGYELETVIVTMGGTDITSSVYTDGVITIESVTGNIVITASATSTAAYTNQLPISTDADGNIYNGKGYKEDTYLSSGVEGSRTGIYSTGFIPAVCGQYVYLQNVGMTDLDNNCRIMLYDNTKTFLASTTTTTSNDHDSWYPVIDENGIVTTIYVSYYKPTTAYIRICCNYLGNDSIITVNEPIDS